MLKKSLSTVLCLLALGLNNQATAQDGFVASETNEIDAGDAWDIEVSETAKKEAEKILKEQLKDTLPVNVATIPKLAFTDGLWNGTVPYPQRFIKAKHVLEIGDGRKLQTKRIQKKWAKRFLNALTDDHYDSLYDCLLDEYKVRGRFSEKSDYIEQIKSMRFTLRGEEFDLNQDGKKDLLFWLTQSKQAKSSETPLFNNDCNQLKEYAISYAPFFILMSNESSYHIAFYGYLSPYVFLADDTYAKYIKSSMYSGGTAGTVFRKDYESMLSHFENSIMEAAQKDRGDKQDYRLVSTVGYLPYELDAFDFYRSFEYRMKPRTRDMGIILKAQELGFYEEYSLSPQTEIYESDFSVAEWQAEAMAGEKERLEGFSFKNIMKGASKTE